VCVFHGVPLFGVSLSIGSVEFLAAPQIWRSAVFGAAGCTAKVRRFRSVCGSRPLQTDPQSSPKFHSDLGGPFRTVGGLKTSSLKKQ
jgi:hypothetical protein